jgi:hypothetical protein
MRKFTSGLGLLLFALPLSLSSRAAESLPTLEQGFRHPPDSARPWVFWFWLNGNITSNGITADLEAMKHVGIGGVSIMDVEQGTPKGPAAFGTPAWLGMFQHTCVEAHRLGIQVEMNDDPGWSGSGGPWVSPELSMQKVVWSETSLQGPLHFEGLLEQPKAERNYYRDIAIFAFPTPENDLVRMANTSPKITASAMSSDFDPAKILDGDPKTAITLPRPEAGNPQFVQIEFPKPFTARTLSLATTGLAQFQTGHGAVEASDDGVHFKTLHEFEAEGSPLMVNFTDVTARHFRVLFTSVATELKEFGVAELELSPRFRIDQLEEKSLLVANKERPPLTNQVVLPAGCAVKADRIIDITSHLGKDGWLTWDVPAGNWTVLRMGHTSTGKDNHPAPELGRGLECDKLSQKAIEVMFEGYIGKLASAVGPLAGKSLISAHVDSWEVLSQNWTPTFRRDFQRLRGYDLLPFLPVMTGRVVGNLDISERFLCDIRRTVSELLVENYAGQLRKLAHRKGLRFSLEAYGGNPSDDLAYAGQADEPMAEFWSWPPYTMAYSCIEMASAAHLYGRPILSAEACTATDAERWLADPYSAKVFVDWAFCHGINRMVMHRFAHQPWTEPERAPGMSMGPWGLHYERTQTWWEQSTAWHEYLSRCQYLLQRGFFVADICHLEQENPPLEWVQPGKSRERPGYNFDVCPSEVVLKRMSVKDGRIVVKGGMTYRLLALPDSESITPPLLAKIKELVEAGATVVGPRPLRSPSLTGYPRCDAEVRRLASELWGDGDGMTIKEHRFGKGRVVRSKTPQQVLSDDGVPPDFSAQPDRFPDSIRYIHKVIGQNDLYFVANKYPQPVEAVCAFRVQGKRAELWRPDSGRSERPAVYDQSGGTTRLPLHFDPYGSVFVLFRADARPEPERIISITRNGARMLETTQPPPPPSVATNQDVANSFTMVVWAKPDVEIDLPPQTNSGSIGLHIFRNDALFPPPGQDLYPGLTNAGSGLSIGRNGVCVFEHGDGYFAPTLVCAAPLTNWTHVAVVYRENKPSLYLDGKLAQEGIRSHFTVHAGAGVRHTRGVGPFRGERGDFQDFDRALTAEEIAQLKSETVPPISPSSTPSIEIARNDNSALKALVWRPGDYVVATAQGKSLHLSVRDFPAPFEITGPWDLTFPPNHGAPGRVTLDHLMSWSDHPDSGVKYFSGTATYNKTFQLPPNFSANDHKLFLDLGHVAVMAQVKLNNTDLGVLWKPPFRLDVTGALKTGANALELKVVNLWVNRMIGDEQLPEDSDRKPDGTLNSWPRWLLDYRPSPSGRITFTSWRLWKKDSSLRQSGLIGPVRIIAAKDVLLTKQ